MKITNLQTDKVVYIESDQVLISGSQDILDLMGETEFQDIVLHDYNFSSDFFDLSTKTLGDVLQKLTNYQVRLAVIGDFKNYPSATLTDFIRESNKQHKYIFVSSLSEVKNSWQL